MNSQKVISIFNVGTFKFEVKCLISQTGFFVFGLQVIDYRINIKA